MAIPGTPGGCKDARQGDNRDESATLSNDSGSGTSSAKDTGDDLHSGDEGHASNIPEESPDSESELALSEQAARIHSDSDQHDT